MVTTLYNKGKSDGVAVHSTTYTMTSDEKTKDLGSNTGYALGTAAELFNASSTSCTNPSFTHSSNWSTSFNWSTHSIFFREIMLLIHIMRYM